MNKDPEGTPAIHLLRCSRCYTVVAGKLSEIFPAQSHKETLLAPCRSCGEWRGFEPIFAVAQAPQGDESAGVDPRSRT